MGRFDVCLKRVFSKPSFFADVFNGFYHEGRQVINPGQLTDQPVQEAYFTTRQEKGKERKVFLKERDILKVAAFKKGMGESFQLLAFEGQSFVDHFMGLRVMAYDLFNYLYQWDEIKDRNKRLGRLKGDAFLSGTTSEDRLRPISTLVLDFSGTLDGMGTSLHSLMDFPSEDFRKMTPDYRINILSPVKLSDEQIGCYSPDVQALFLAARSASDRAKLKEVFKSNSLFAKVDYSIACMIDVITQINLDLFRDEEQPEDNQRSVNMQLEYLTPLEIGKREGEEIGFRKGEKIGFCKGEELGLRKGEELGLRKGLQIGEMRGTILAMHAQKASREATGKLLMKLYHLTLEEANQMIDSMPNLG
jgi:hypothetical protein